MNELIDQTHATARISWGAVFAGTLIALTILAALSLLGTGLGLMRIAGPESPLGVVTVTALWWLATASFAFYAGGWFAGRLNPVGRISDSVLHGLLAWSAASLILLFLVGTGLGQVLIGATSAFGRAVEGARAEAAMRDATRASQAAGLFGFLAMLLEAVAAGLGGRFGSRHSHRERARHMVDERQDIVEESSRRRH